MSSPRNSATPQRFVWTLAVIALGLGTAAAQTPPPGQMLLDSPTQTATPADIRPSTPVTDDERSAVAISSLSLDLHLIPGDSRLETHATLTLRNSSSHPATRIPLQLSSTLHWLAASAATPTGLQPIPFTQSPIATDADHTGYAQEAIFTPAEPLAPGATLTLSVFYSGTIPQNSDRLELIGAPHDRATQTDWDAVADTSDDASTALRGFGNVLWYPVAAPVARFGDGNRLFDLIAKDRLHNASVTMRLRLTVEYLGDPPDSVVFNGQLRPLTLAPDTQDQLIEATKGIATADFLAAPIGFRTPSLFLTAQYAVTTADQALTYITPVQDLVEPYADAVTSLEPVLSALLGPTPRSPMVLLDHSGEPFEDDSFLAAQLSSSAEAKLVAPKLVRALTHAWFSPQSRSVPPTSLWIEEGLPEYMSFALTERTQGREAAIGELRHASVLIALAEGTTPDTAQPLTNAYSDAFLRLKSAFVFWQLRALLGDEAFTQALTAFRHSLALNPAFDADPKAFQHTLEKFAKQPLDWFFEDWVYHDRSLPDLTIVQANPRPLAGRSGNLVAVEVRNDGDAVADVPVTVRAGALSATERLRIGGHSSASTRIVFEGTPESVEVNDGSVAELRATTHTLNIPEPTTPMAPIPLP